MTTPPRSRPAMNRPSPYLVVTAALCAVAFLGSSPCPAQTVPAPVVAPADQPEAVTIAPADPAAPRTSGRPRPERPRRSGPGGESLGPWQQLNQDSVTPEEAAELRRLRKEDPAAFRQKMRELVKRRRHDQGERVAPEQPFQALREEYLAAPDEATREQVRLKLVAAVKAEFQERMEANRQRLEQARARLAEIERKYQERVQQAERILEDRVRALTAPPKPKPKPKPEPEPTEPR